MGIRRLTLTRAIRVARGNDVACREAGDTKSTLIAASWPSYTLLSMLVPFIAPVTTLAASYLVT